MSNVIVNTAQPLINVTTSDIDGNFITNTVISERMPEIKIVETSLQSLSRLIPGSAPQSASEYGQPGEIRWDSNYMYLCTAANTWKKITLSEL